LAPFALITVRTGDAIHVCAVATPGAGGVLSYSVSNLPAGGAFDAQGCFDWMPGADQGGSYPCILVRVTESPSQAFDQTCLAIRVLAPTEPEPDSDFDGVGDRSDNCPSIPNHDQADSDRDG